MFPSKQMGLDISAFLKMGSVSGTGSTRDFECISMVALLRVDTNHWGCPAQHDNCRLRLEHVLPLHGFPSVNANLEPLPRIS